MLLTWLHGNAIDGSLSVLDERKLIIVEFLTDARSWWSVIHVVHETLGERSRSSEREKSDELLALCVVAADKADNLDLASRCLQKLTGKSVSIASRAVNHYKVAPYYKLYCGLPPTFSNIATREIRRRWSRRLRGFRTMFF